MEYHLFNEGKQCGCNKIAFEGKNKKDQKQGDKYRKQNRLTNRACDKQNCLLGKIPVFLDNKDITNWASVKHFKSFMHNKIRIEK